MSHFRILVVEMKAEVVAWYISGSKTLAMRDAECVMRDGLRSYLLDPWSRLEAVLSRGISVQYYLCETVTHVARRSAYIDAPWKGTPISGAEGVSTASHMQATFPNWVKAEVFPLSICR